MLLDGLAGVGNINLRQLLSGEEHQLFVVFVFQHGAEFLVLLHVDGAVAVCAGQDATVGKSMVYLVVDAFVVVRMVCQTEAYRSHHRYEMQFKHAFGGKALIWRHYDEQSILLRVCLADVADDGDVVRLCGLQIVGSLIAHL